MRDLPMTNREAKKKFEDFGIDVDQYEINNRRWFIPIAEWREATGKRFTPQMKRGWQVVLHQYNKRWRHRRVSPGCANEYTFRKELGIGSGKNYRDITINSRVKLGSIYLLNRLHAESKAKALTAKGCYEIDYFNRIKPVNKSKFYKYTKLKADGMLGPKKIIRGTITEVYVYVSSWNYTRREARYRVQWENGAEGVFTSDYLRKSFATDYDLDERWWACERSDLCGKCKDKITQKPQSGFCPRVGAYVKDYKMLDYTNFMDTTVGMGQIIDEPKKTK